MGPPLRIPSMVLEWGQYILELWHPHWFRSTLHHRSWSSLEHVCNFRQPFSWTSTVRNEKKQLAWWLWVQLLSVGDCEAYRPGIDQHERTFPLQRRCLIKINENQIPEKKCVPDFSVCGLGWGNEVSILMDMILRTNYWPAYVMVCRRAVRHCSWCNGLSLAMVC